MASSYYQPCKELEACNELIEKYWKTQQYDKCFQGYLPLAQKGYPLAECQVGYFYWEGLGVDKNLEEAFAWSLRAAEHGDWDGQCNLAELYEKGLGTNPDQEKADFWYRQAALQNHELAIQKCRERGIALPGQTDSHR